ncbi:thermonuclease family protein [Halomarinibacterium sedimenti]|uniref:thermonuclease family protein n=1 Tax=Halomarinibacterium sedimenti TaxID=2857106 RepID=UPI002107F23D|nr:thermonuclease family protein [Halomarinibacterium sedimenti]
MNFRNLFFVFICFLFCLRIAAQSNSIEGKVVAITDGDTFKLITKDSTLYRIRVANIDCPERKQPFSKRAKQFTSQAIFGDTVLVMYDKKDRYGRIIGFVKYDNGRDLSEELLKNGLAWHFIKYSKDKTLQALEDRAKINKIGLWSENNPIAPWDWRKN